MRKTKVLFVSDFILDYIPEMSFIPYGLLQVSAFARRQGYECFLSTTRPRELRKVFAREQIDVVAYSCIAGSFEKYLITNRQLKKTHNFVSVFGGPFITFFPGVIEDESIDAVNLGEGEESFCDLLERIEQKRPFSDIPNLWVKDNGRVIKNDLRPLIKNLDSLPFPDRSLYYDHYPEAAMVRRKTFMASRGCPFSCSYCYNHRYKALYEGKGPLVRFRSVENVIEEIERARAAYPLDFVHFIDDTFTLNKEWLRQFAAAYKKQINLPLSGNVRIDRFDAEIADCLAEANCRNVIFAVESGNADVRADILKRPMTNKMILDNSRLLKERGIHFVTQNMVGIPGTTFADDRETLDLNIQVKPDYAWVSICQPYYNTELYDYALKNGYIKEKELQQTQKDRYDVFPKSIHDISIINIDARHKRAVEKMHRLFAIIVDWTILREKLNGLSVLPMWLLTFLRNYHAAYKFKKIYPFKMSLKSKIKNLYRVLVRRH